ncbi:MAG: hypothetical protein MJ175_03325, partial [Clostridia bacterium]|nr:hypothetical protein [Clostridia bacterium]
KQEEAPTSNACIKWWVVHRKEDFMSRYRDSCEETMLTVFKKLGEDDNGAGWYTVLHCPGFVEQYESADISPTLRVPEKWMTGFLFPSVSEDGNRNILPVSLLPGSDYVAYGIYDGTPGEAIMSGAAVYIIVDTARPSRFISGRQVTWCHFRAVLVGKE